MKTQKGFTVSLIALAIVLSGLIALSPFKFMNGKWTFMPPFAFAFTDFDVPSATKFTSSDNAAGDEFGIRIEVEGDLAIVGAYHDDDTFSNSGSAYIFRKSGGTWSQIKKLVGGDPATDDWFGIDVAISADYALVGAYGDDDLGSLAGSAYIFEKDLGGVDNWGERKRLFASDGAWDDRFGIETAISGTYLFIGAPNHDETFNVEGAIYMFEKDQGGANNWGEVKEINASDAVAFSQFGGNLSIDGDRMIVGASRHGNGQAYIFERNLGGAENWGERAILTASDGAVNDFFGTSVAVLGNYAFVGAYQDDDTIEQSGSVYVFEKDSGGADNWGQTKKIVASDPEWFDYFGRWVEAGVDQIYVSSRDDDDGSQSGSVYVFQKDFGGVDNWGERVKLTAQDAAAGDEFGAIMSLYGDELFISATGDDDNGTSSGSAYIFDVTTLPPLPPGPPTGGGGGGGASCSVYPVKLDLPSTLKVLEQAGKQVVELNWGDVQVADEAVKQRIEVFMNYLAQQPVPQLGSEGNSLQGIFSRHFHDEIYNSNKPALISAFEKEMMDKEISDLPDAVCSSETSADLMDIIVKLMNDADLQKEVNEITLKFIDELLDLENSLSGISDHENTFVEYFNRNFQLLSEGTYNEMTLEIYRDGKKIYSQANPRISSYTDENVPLNTSSRVKSHNYYILTATECDTKIGTVGKAFINPELEPGTDIDVTADVSVKIKDGFSKLLVEKLEALVQAAKMKNLRSTASEQTALEVQSNHSLSCSEATTNIETSDLNSDVVMNYILACYGSPEINSALELKRVKIIPPILIALSLNNIEEVTDVIDRFIEPTIQELTEQIGHEKEVFRLVGEELAKLDISQGISGFDEAEKELIMCAGIPNCSQDTKNKVEAYFKGSSHAADLSVEVYDEADTQVHQVNATTNLFGEVEGVELGEFLSGTEYTIKIRLTGQHFVLPKVSLITLNSGEPKSGGGYKAHLNLDYSNQFRYGNFDESNDVIDKNDILTWGKLLSEQPELWDDSNLDGLYGVDLLDAITFQQNWGAIQESQVGEDQITLMELAELFGLFTSLETKVQVPAWLNFLEFSCKP